MKWLSEGLPVRMRGAPLPGRAGQVSVGSPVTDTHSRLRLQHAAAGSARRRRVTRAPQPRRRLLQPACSSEDARCALTGL